MDNVQINANQFPEIYKSLGIKIGDLGCVMLDVDLGEAIAGADEFLGDNAYVSTNQDRWWINGIVGLETPHMTLLYGLLKPAKEWKQHIDAVLEGWSVENVKIREVGYFESTYEDEQYYCIVAHVKVTPEIMAGRQRLELLPHINTFTDYKSHITLAYIKKDPQVLAAALEWFNTRLHSALVPVAGLNLGNK